MTVRWSKALMVLMVGAYALLVGLDNIIDYGVNLAGVERVLSMDTIFPTSRLTWRAITSPIAQNGAYWLIIASELLIGLLCVLGAVRLWIARRGTVKAFQAAKQLAVIGLVFGFTLWFFGFLVIAGEWFLMWQSKDWNAQQSAFRVAVCCALVLIFLNQRDDELG